MPRVYKTKDGSKKRDPIDKEILQRAVYDVVYLEKSLRGTAKTYNLSVMTFKRTTETLKKLWGKMKSEAKTYKAANKKSVSGTGGGPSKTFDDPALELVVEMTGRASTGIVNINDCDANADEPLIENVNFSPQPDEEFLNVDMMDFGEEQIIIEAVKETDAAPSTADASGSKSSKDRRIPVINASTERPEKTKQQARVSNRFAAERLRAEQEKTNLIVQQLKQNEELHEINMQNEKIKQEILEALLQKNQGNNYYI